MAIVAFVWTVGKVIIASSLLFALWLYAAYVIEVIGRPAAEYLEPCEVCRQSAATRVDAFEPMDPRMVCGRAIRPSRTDTTLGRFRLVSHNYPRKAQLRRARLEPAAVAIEQLEAAGYQLEMLKPNHYRVNGRLDLFPLAGRYFDLAKLKGGVYVDPLTIAKDVLDVE